MAYKVPEPAYKIISKDGSFEIRQYPSMLVAEVEIEGDRLDAIKAGFKILANYIFGNNQPRNKMSITTPITQQGMSIAMTAPVIQQKKNEAWNIRFIMPSVFTLKNIPKPNNSAIKLLYLPGEKYAVICFTGSNTNDNLSKHEALLNQYLLKHQIKKLGNPLYAFYNPPWILPFLRRNEILIEISP